MIDAEILGFALAAGLVADQHTRDHLSELGTSQ